VRHFPEYQRSLDELRGRYPDLAVEFDRFGGVSDLLAWMQSSGRAKAAVDMIGQDEFEYDFLIEFSPDGTWLAFGLT
jgi:hypothetical protein